jgi:predicted dehydrogenase
VIGSVHLDFVQRPPVHRLEIIGSEGTIQWNNDNGAVWVYSGNGIVETYPLLPNFERNELFLAEMRHFIEVVRGDADPLCNLDDGIWALKLALAAHESAKTGQLIKW